MDQEATKKRSDLLNAAVPKSDSVDGFFGQEPQTYTRNDFPFIKVHSRIFKIERSRLEKEGGNG